MRNAPNLGGVLMTDARCQVQSQRVIPNKSVKRSRSGNETSLPWLYIVIFEDWNEGVGSLAVASNFSGNLILHNWSKWINTGEKGARGQDSKDFFNARRVLRDVSSHEEASREYILPPIK